MTDQDDKLVQAVNEACEEIRKNTVRETLIWARSKIAWASGYANGVSRDEMERTFTSEVLMEPFDNEPIEGLAQQIADRVDRNVQEVSEAWEKVAELEKTLYLFGAGIDDIDVINGLRKKLEIAEQNYDKASAEREENRQRLNKLGAQWV